MSMDICFLKKATEDYKNANKKNHIPVYLNYSKSSDDQEIHEIFKCELVLKEMFD